MANPVLRFVWRSGLLYLVGSVVAIIFLVSVGRQVSVTVSQQSFTQGGGGEGGRGGRGDAAISPAIASERKVPIKLSRKPITRRSTTNPNIVSPAPVSKDDLNWIRHYQKQEEKWCQEMVGNRTGVNWCPCIPPGLQGRVVVNKADDWDWERIEETVGADVRAGGEWMPENCVARTRLAVIIPCRDREKHLRVLLRHLIPILKRQLVHFRIIVPDQRYPMIFNKAALMDIGFLEAQKRFPFDCAMFHDVDMLLEDDRAMMKCGPQPRHYARALDKFGYKLYPTFGGVVSLTADMFRTVNGYSLKYFGWGGEDDDMWSRVGTLWSIYGMPAVVSRYSTIFHVEDATNQRNPVRHHLMDVGFEQNRNRSFDGLSQLAYDVNSVEMKPLFTRFEVDMNTTVLRYPGHKTYRYQRVPGFCKDPDVILTSSEVSWSSCRFQCDTMSGQACFGFSHVIGKCVIIRAVCNISPVDGWTYVKTEEIH